MTLLLRRRGTVCELPVVDEFARRQALTVGAVKPDATNTGLLNMPSRPLTTLAEGNYTASTAGAVVKDLEILGKLIITAANVVVDNCWIRGPATRPTGGNEGLVEVAGTNLNATIRDCLLEPRASGSSLDGIRTRNYTAIRCRIRGVTDGFGATTGTANTPANVQILMCWVENMAKFYPDTDVTGSHTDGTHNDCVQIQGGTGTDNIVIRGCRLESYLSTTAGNTSGLNTDVGGAAFSPTCTQGNAVIQLNQAVGNLAGLRIENNWLYGGRIAVNGTAISSAVDLGFIQNNKFDRGQYLDVANQGTDTTQTLRINPTPTCVTTGNTYENNGNAVTVRRTT